MTDDRPERVTRLKKWLIAGRPWALPASTMPVLFGTSLAVVIGGARSEEHTSELQSPCTIAYAVFCL